MLFDSTLGKGNLGLPPSKLPYQGPQI